ncbi:hypothetical protein RA231_000326 [Cronobacter turicensis]|nr:hypothetical protein [Cronobacter turicensis]EKY1992307.1 hypothetical protein [Cronobacter turicensis]ELQ6105669.1 hypothetical protein [Cronobacter turicensis]
MNINEASELENAIGELLLHINKMQRDSEQISQIVLAGNFYHARDEAGEIYKLASPRLLIESLSECTLSHIMRITGTTLIDFSVDNSYGEKK